MIFNYDFQCHFCKHKKNTIYYQNAILIVAILNICINKNLTVIPVIQLYLLQKSVWQNIMVKSLYYNFILILLYGSYCFDVNRAEWSKFPCAKHYQNGELHVDCSHKSLTQIPQLPKNTVHLNLQHNWIQYIPNNVFKNMTNLTVLDLSFNCLDSIGEHAFNGLQKLVQLKLNNNKLKYNSRARFPAKTFQPLESLKILSVRSNTDSIVFSDQKIAFLKKLEILELDVYFCHYEHDEGTYLFGKKYSKLSNLYSVHIYCQDKCFSVCNITFKYIPNLTHLYILYFKSFTFKHLAFATLKKLKFLQIDFSASTLMTHTLYIPEIIFELSYTQIKILIIQNVVFYDTFDNDCIWKSINENLNITSLQQLHLTNIKDFHPKCVYSQTTINLPPSLQILNLTGNDFSWTALNLNSVVSLILKHNRLGSYLANNSYMISHTSNLENICLSHNSIYKLNTDIFKGQPYLKYIDLSNNFLSNISFKLFHLKQLKILNLSNNRIQFLNKKSMKEIDRLLNKTTNTRIDLRNNLLRCNCYTVPFLKWMKQIGQNFIKFSQYQCTYENGTISKAYSFERVILYLEQDYKNTG